MNVSWITRHGHKDGQCSNLRFAPALNEPLRNNNLYVSSGTLLVRYVIYMYKNAGTPAIECSSTKGSGTVCKDNAIRIVYVYWSWIHHRFYEI